MNDRTDFDASKFESQLREQLRGMEHNLDASTRQRLAGARRHALSKARRWSLPRFTVPVAGMALASVAALALLFSPLTDNGTQGMADNRVTDNIEFYEDLDFYYWLSETEPDLRG